MNKSLEQGEVVRNVEVELATFLDFHEGSFLRIGIRGSREYLDSFLYSFRKKNLKVVEVGLSSVHGNNFPIPEDFSGDEAGYVVVVDSTGDWDNHSMNKYIKENSDLKITDEQNAVFISWSHDMNDTSGGGSEFDVSFSEK